MITVSNHFPPTKSPGNIGKEHGKKIFGIITFGEAVDQPLNAPFLSEFPFSGTFSSV